MFPLTTVRRPSPVTRRNRQTSRFAWVRPRMRCTCTTRSEACVQYASWRGASATICNCVCSCVLISCQLHQFVSSWDVNYCLSSIYTTCWGYSLINTLKLKKKYYVRVCAGNVRGTLIVAESLRQVFQSLEHWWGTVNHFLQQIIQWVLYLHWSRQAPLLSLAQSSFTGDTAALHPECVPPGVVLRPGWDPHYDTSSSAVLLKIGSWSQPL